MEYLSLISNSVKEQTARIPDLVNREIFERKDEIIALNIQQINNHIGSDGGDLLESNPSYGGYYTKATQQYAEAGKPSFPNREKIENQPYNFDWTGSVFSGFFVKKEGFDYRLGSTGIGGGKKKAFFDGYKYFFGLTEDHELEIFKEVADFVVNEMLEQIYK